jgi:hypothetical protein
MAAANWGASDPSAGGSGGIGKGGGKGGQPSKRQRLSSPVRSAAAGSGSASSVAAGIGKGGGGDFDGGGDGDGDGDGGGGDGEIEDRQALLNSWASPCHTVISHHSNITNISFIWQSVAGHRCGVCSGPPLVAALGRGSVVESVSGHRLDLQSVAGHRLCSGPPLVTAVGVHSSRFD